MSCVAGARRRRQVVVVRRVSTASRPRGARSRTGGDTPRYGRRMALAAALLIAA
jgi:hypothetical protein